MYPEEFHVIPLDEIERIERERKARRAWMFPAGNERPAAPRPVRPIPLYFRLLMSGAIVGVLIGAYAFAGMAALGGAAMFAVLVWLVWALARVA